MTYPDPQVAAFIGERLVPLRLLLHDPAHQPYFRAHRILWTPTSAILDRRGVAHYQSPGYLPPPLFLDMLHIGTARAHLAWAGYDAAAALLAPVADNAASALAAEALYWLGVARYLKERRRAPMMEAWTRLRERYPDSVWATRIPPNQEEGEG